MQIKPFGKKDKRRLKLRDKKIRKYVKEGKYKYMTSHGPSQKFKDNRRYLTGVRRFAYGHSYRGVDNGGRDPIGGVGQAPSLGTANNPKPYIADANFGWENGS